MTSCSVCCENYTQSTRKNIECPYCNYQCCLVCFKKYLLVSHNHPNCMNCGKDINNDFLASHTPNNFHNGELRNKIALDMLSTEKSLLPSSQHLVEEIKNARQLNTEINNLIKQKTELSNQIRNINTQIFRLRTTTIRDNQDREKRQFTMRCSRSECRGFLSTSWKCGTCTLYTCPECHQPKNNKIDPEHICKTEDIETAKLLAKDTKPCPGCSIPVFKISGCDLMWCVQCHVTWSWKTNLVVKVSHNHNPHFYQFQRNRNSGAVPRNPGDNPCEHQDVPWPQLVQQIMRQRGHTWKYWLEALRMVGHMRNITLPRYPLQNGIADNSDLRAKYLMNEISEERWIKELKKRKKRDEKNRSVHQVVDMFINTLTDIFNGYVNNDEFTKSSHPCSLEVECEALRNYVNNQLSIIEKRYNNRVISISSYWREI